MRNLQWHDKKYSAAYFDFAGAVNVRIKPNPAALNTTAALDQFAIRPSKYGIQPTVDNGVAAFSTDTPPSEKNAPGS